MVERAFWPVEGGGRPPSTNGERINESDRGPRTADRRMDGGRTGFPACRGRGQTAVNEWGTNQRIRPRTADGRRQVVVGRAFQPVRQWTADRGMDGGRTGFPACRGMGVTVNEWGTNQRMETADRGRQTAGRCRTGFPARQTMDCRPQNGRW